MILVESRSHNMRSASKTKKIILHGKGVLTNRVMGTSQSHWESRISWKGIDGTARNYNYMDMAALRTWIFNEFRTTGLHIHQCYLSRWFESKFASKT
jgi:hypothetical protein